MLVKFNQTLAGITTTVYVDMPDGTTTDAVLATFPLVTNIVLNAKREPGIVAANALKGIRTKRDSLLTSSDWTQMPDSPLSKKAKAEWAAYRQALRDITKTADPTTVSWPAEPA